MLKIEALDYLGDDLEPFRAVAVQIAETFGHNCEVVIHDFTHPANSVVLVVNGTVTGRSLGQPFNDLMQIIRSPLLKNDQISNYSKETANGKVLKSSTALIRNASKEIVGALCINIDISEEMKMRKKCDDFCKTVDLSNKLTDIDDEKYDIVSSDISDILVRIINKTIADMAIPPAIMTKEQKLAIVSFLYEKEVFTIKGAVDELAQQLCVSRYTIYNYIDEVKHKK